MLAQKLMEVAELKQQISGFNNQLGAANQLGEQVQNLVNQGIIKQDESGNLVEVEDANERDSIQSMTGSKKRPAPDRIPENRRHA